MELDNMISKAQSNHAINARQLINSLLIMFIVCESMMNTILVSILPIDNLLGYSMLLLGALVISIQQIRLNYKIFALVVFCIMSFMISGMRGYMSDSILYMIQFLSFGIVGIVGARIKFDYISIFRHSVIVSEIFIIINQINKGMIESDFSFGYALIPGVLSSVYLIYNSWKGRNIRNIFKYGVLAIPIFIQFVLRSSRGNLAQLAIFILLGLFFLFGYKKFATILTGIGILAILNLREIVLFLNEWANVHGLTISVIWKTYYLLNTTGQSFSHGRGELLDIVKQNAEISTYLFGNGIGAFEHVAGTYPHNIFLSAFCDFGLIGIIFVIILLVKFFRVLRTSNSSIELPEKEFVLLIFTLSFIKLCFSGVYWNSSTFWYLVSYLF